MGNPADFANPSDDLQKPGHDDDQSEMLETDYPNGNETSHPQAVNYPPSAPSGAGGSVYSGTQGVPLHHQQNAQPYPPQQTYAPPQNSQMNNPLYQPHPQHPQQPYPSPIHNYQGAKSPLPHQPGSIPTQPAYPQQTYSQMQTPPPTSPYQQAHPSYPVAGVPLQSQPMYPNKPAPVPVPTPNNYPPNSAIRPGTNAWTTGLFDCMEDPNNALVTFAAPCVTFGQIAEIVDEGQSTCSTSGIIYSAILFFTAAPCLISCGYRSKLRSKYDLVEVPAPDWMTHVFFEWCALCQEYRELKNRGYDPAIGWHGNQMRLQAMQRQQQQVQMTPPMYQNMNG
ncbi:hypothetical protein MKX01_008767 [Papaver californicum]|nr:hypothetical protein MKX01_008767 [Papaver californicum]